MLSLSQSLDTDVQKRKPEFALGMPDRTSRRDPGSDVMALRSRKGFSYLAGDPLGRRIGRHEEQPIAVLHAVLQ